RAGSRRPPRGARRARSDRGPARRPRRTGRGRQRTARRASPSRRRVLASRSECRSSPWSSPPHVDNACGEVLLLPSSDRQPQREGTMDRTSELERRIQALEDVEAIKQLKHRYWRCLDLKLWDELAGCFTQDAHVEYGEGRYRFQGVKAIMHFLTQ